ncbi:MAG: histidine phosphatase family protein [Bacteroidota bacterium]
MKQITFLRHAKSDWANNDLKDIDRALNERGYLDAYEGSAIFLNENLIPDRLYTSTATRALSTALIFARTLNFRMQQFQLEPRLYETSVHFLLSFIQSQNDTDQHVMLVGHNPATTEACNAFLKSGSIDEVPTCGLFTLIFNCKNWKNVKFESAELKYFQYPKMNKKNN